MFLGFSFSQSYPMFREELPRSQRSVGLSFLGRSQVKLRHRDNSPPKFLPGWDPKKLKEGRVREGRRRSRAVEDGEHKPDQTDEIVIRNQKKR